MNLFFTLSFIGMMTQSTMLYDFNASSSTGEWQVLNDGVMGGRSQGKIALNEDGHGVFTGEVSLENNGGFTSIQHRLDFDGNASNYQFVEIKLKGDGKRYQFRIKSSVLDRYSYIAYFQTSGSWETISIPLASMYPSFRGRKLDLSNFNEEDIEQIAILISNKVEERFELVIDRIQLR